MISNHDLLTRNLLVCKLLQYVPILSNNNIFQIFIRYPPNSDTYGNGDKKTTPDNELFRSLSVEYSVHNKKIYSGKGCNGSGRNRGISTGNNFGFSYLLLGNML